MIKMNPYPDLRKNPFFEIKIWHLPTEKEVVFDGWVTNFSDSYTSQWQEEMVYGRMDPLATYQRTGRSISLGFDIPNDSKSHAIANMAKVRQLIKFMYPLYAENAMAQQNTLQSGPLLGLKWTNLISSPNNSGEKLIGYINGGLAYSPEVTEGGFIMGAVTKDLEKPFEVTPRTAIKNYFPKKLSLSFTFTVLHTHLVGWAPSGTGGKSFTFGGSQGTDEAFPNAFIGLPPPDPEDGGARGDRETADDANGNLNPNDDPTPAQEAAKKEAREECQSNAADNFANQGLISGNEENVGAPGICGEDAEGDDGGGVVVDPDGDQ